MTDADRERSERVIATMSETYKDTFSAPRAELYFQSLRRFEIEDIEAALPILMREPARKVVPKPSDFVETIERNY